MGGRRSDQAIKLGSILKITQFCHTNSFQTQVRAGDYAMSLEDDDEFKLYIKVLHVGETKWLTKDVLECVDT